MISVHNFDSRTLVVLDPLRVITRLKCLTRLVRAKLLATCNLRLRLILVGYNYRRLVLFCRYNMHLTAMGLWLRQVVKTRHLTRVSLARWNPWLSPGFVLCRLLVHLRQTHVTGILFHAGWCIQGWQWNIIFLNIGPCLHANYALLALQAFFLFNNLGWVLVLDTPDATECRAKNSGAQHLPIRAPSVVLNLKSFLHSTVGSFRFHFSFYFKKINKNFD